MALRYIYHKTFNVNSSSGRIKPAVVPTEAQRLASLKSRVNGMKAKSNLGPNGKPKLTYV